MKIMKNIYLPIRTSLAIITVVLLMVVQSARGAGTFNQNYIIGDSIFNNSSAMSASQIDAFLNSFPSSCISTNNGFATPESANTPPNTTNDDMYTWGPTVSAGQAISQASQMYDLNPQVLLATMQKEQSVVTGSVGCHYTNPSPGKACTYSGGGCVFIAMSYACPGGCSVTYSTTNGTGKGGIGDAFSLQLYTAAWQLRWNEERSFGITSGYVGYDNGDSSISYGGPTVGSVDVLSDGTSVTIDNGSTASLYYYTPFISGNQNFFNIFSTWFGNPVTPCLATTNVGGATSGDKVIAYQYTANSPTNLAFSELNNTGSACSELHIWNSGEQTWAAHIATAMRATNPTQGTLIAINTADNGPDNLAYILYGNSQGNLEIHKFSPSLQTFPGYYDMATDLTGVSASTGTFVAGDFLGSGRDQLAYVLYSGSQGAVEVHLFNPALNQAIGYYDMATDLTGVSASTGTFVAGDFLGNGKDQLAYILYSGSGGHVEVHLFNPALNQAIGYYDVVTNLTGVSASTGTFVAGNFLGNGKDQLAYVLYSGSQGTVEVHLFNSALTQAIGYNDTSTNLGAFNPNN